VKEGERNTHLFTYIRFRKEERKISREDRHFTLKEGKGEDQAKKREERKDKD